MKYLYILQLTLLMIPLHANKKSLDSLEQLLNSSRSDTLKCKYLSKMAMYSEKGEKLNYYRRIYQLCEKRLNENGIDPNSKNTFLKYKSFSIKGFAYLNLSNHEYDSALSNYSKALNIDASLKNNAGQITCLRNMAVAYQRMGKSQLATIELKKAIELATDSDLVNELAEIYFSLGQVYSNIGNNDQVILYSQKAIEVYKINGQKKKMAQTLQILGITYSNIGNIPEALKCYAEEQKIYEETGDQESLAYTFFNIGIIFDTQGDLEKGLDYYKKSLNIGVKAEISHIICNIYNAIAGIYLKQGKIREALSYYGKGLETAEKNNNSEGLANSYAGFGSCYIHQDSLGKGIIYFQKAAAIFEQINDKWGASSTYNSLAGVLLKKGDRYSAKKTGELSLKLAKELEYPEHIKNSSETLSKIYNSLGEWKKAYEMVVLSKLMHDSLMSEKNKKKSIEYEFIIKASKDSISNAKEKEIKNAELKKREAEIKANKNLQYALFGGLALVMLFAGFTFSRWKVTQKQKAIIEEQKTEVEKQKSLVEYKQKEILDSIHYARRIQLAQIPSDKRILNSLKRSR